MAELEGRVAFITGASRGIGRAIARRFAAEGAAVIVSASRAGAHGDLEGTLEETVRLIAGEGGRVAAVACDLSDADARADLMARVNEPYGAVDVLVNNAARGCFEMPSTMSTEPMMAMIRR